MSHNTIPDPESSLVRVWDEARKAVVGIGFLVPGGRVVTCAHVVVQALKLPVDAVILPEHRDVTLDFPRISANLFVPARVHSGHVGVDVALLRLIGDAPEGARPLRFAHVEDVREMAFEAFGCPHAPAPAAAFNFLGLGSAPKREQYVGGVWAWGQLRRRQGDDFLQCDQAERTTYRVQGGFSGGPVWVPHLQVAVALVARFDATEVSRAAFAIPMGALFRAFPELKEHATLPQPSDRDVGALLAVAATRIRGLAQQEAYEVASMAEFEEFAFEIRSVAEGMPPVSGFKPKFAKALKHLADRLSRRAESIRRELRPLNERLAELNGCIEAFGGLVEAPSVKAHKHGIRKV